MLSAITLLAASLVRLGDLAVAVEADTYDHCADFCVTGTVTYVLNFQEKFYHVLVEDGGIGVDIVGTINPGPPPVPGDRVRIDGAIVPSVAGSIIPEFRTLEGLGRGKAPAPVEGSAEEIMSGRHDFQRAHLVGELRDVEPSGTNPCWNYLSIISGGRQYYAPIPSRGATLAELEALIGSTVKLDGFPNPHNSSYRFLEERHFLVSNLDKIEILSRPPDDPFEKAPPVAALRRLSPEMMPRLGRHKAEGRLITIWQSRNALLMMKDERCAIVSFIGPVGIPRGQSVEVIGYPSTDGFMLRLSRAIARLGECTPFKEPPTIPFSESDFKNHLSAESLTKITLQGKRLQLCGTVADFGERQRESKTLSLAIAGRLLDIDFSAVPQSCGEIIPGCRVRVAGTCVLATENWSSLSSGTQLIGIRLVVDRPNDVEIVARPPWWNLTRLTVVVAILVLIITTILIWNRALRNLSEKRGRELFRERSASALAELKTTERTRLAADIHDSISQILTGAAMQLDAGETNAAKRILASCRRELRACLWDLRNHALDAENFADAVRETIAPHLRGRAVVIDLNFPSDKMSEAFRHAALCIIREATVNAIRHGRAETIEIAGELSERRLVFTVTDDGKGFDPANCHGSADGHFGILGMRERAKAFNGSVKIASKPGNGTKVSVVLEEKETK